MLVGIDHHEQGEVIACQRDGGSIEPARKLSEAELRRWVEREVGKGWELTCCYEVGGLGFNLQRKLAAAGARCLVVQPRDWDRYGEHRKTDARDAEALCRELGRFLSGEGKALKPVRVPSLPEQEAVAPCRQRYQLVCERRRLESQGRSLLRLHGYAASSGWWHAAAWARWERILPGWLVDRLKVWKQLLDILSEQSKRLAREMAGSVTGAPRGFGALTLACLGREIGDWNRFANRRQAGAFAGLVPRCYQSGNTDHRGPINRRGNPAIRWQLVELAWRVVRWQPEYWAWKRWQKRLAGDTKPGRSVMKKVIVALARQLAVDLWRLNTGRTTPEKLGLVM